MRKYYLATFLIPLFALCGCEALFEEDPDFALYSNSPVSHGQTLELGFAQSNSGYTYTITAPDGRVYDYQDVVINQANFTDAGVYKLLASGKRSIRQTITIEVIPEDFDCSVPENRFLGGGFLPFARFDTIIGREFEGGYRVFSFGSDGYMVMDFESAEPPRGDRTYETVWSNFVSGVSVRVAFVDADGRVYFGLGDQLLHVRQESGKTHFYICDFNFSSGQADAHVVLP